MSDKGLPMDVVYLGKRWANDKKLVVVFAPLLSEGKLGEEQWYTFKQAMDKVVGNIYRGASFEGSTAYGLTTMRWTGDRWPVVEDRMRWDALDTAAAVAKKQQTLEAKSKKSKPLEECLLPLRKLYDNARRRGDRIECEAIVQAVLVAIRKPPED